MYLSLRFRNVWRRHVSTTSKSNHAHRLPTNPGPLARAKIAEIDTARGGVSPVLVDTFRREHTYLRISLTEKCNLRCFYCMPAEGVELYPKGHILTDDEIIRLARLFVQNGVTKIRLTGGEPTIRKGLLDIVRRLNDLRQYGLRSIGMTTNGLILHRNLPQFVDNGLTHLNLSLDTLDPFKFEIISRRNGLPAVLKTLEAAEASNLQAVKLNVVVIKDLNDSEIPAFVELTKEKNLSVRFIEFMPFNGNRWNKEKMVPSSILLDHLQKLYPTITKATDELNDTARSFKIPGYLGYFGFISSMSDHFCSTCNRMRITADGKVKVCLFDAKEISLRDKMRQGATDEEILQTIGMAVRGKKEKHAGMEDIDVTTNRPMILIGVQNQPSRNGHSPLLPMYRPLCSTTRSPPSRSLVTTLSNNHVPLRRQMSTNPLVHEPTSLPTLTHFDHKTGRAQMVDVSSKSNTLRIAQASGRIYIPEVAYKLITSDDSLSNSEITENLAKAEKVRRKGDVLAVAQLAGIMACKRTSDLIPLCHPLPLSNIEVVLTPAMNDDSNGSRDRRYSISCRASVSCEGKTGVEMEALTAVSAALLTVWDMLKAVAGKEMLIGDIVVESKSGGKSDFQRTFSNKSQT